MIILRAYFVKPSDPKNFVLLFSVTCILMSSVGQRYGVGNPDKVSMCLILFGILKAEPMPKWFTKTSVQTYLKHNQETILLSRGSAGNGLLLIYCVCGSFLSMAFIRCIHHNMMLYLLLPFTIHESNIRAMLMIPMYEQPIDTTENIFRYDKVPLINLEGSFWKDYLMESPNYWERKVGASMSCFGGWDFGNNRG